MGMSLKEKIVGVFSAIVPLATLGGLYAWGREKVCLEGGRAHDIDGNVIYYCDKYSSSKWIELEDAVIVHWPISGSALAFSLACWGYLAKQVYKRHVEKKISKMQNDDNYSYYLQQNIEKKIESNQSEESQQELLHQGQKVLDTYLEPQSQDYQTQNISNTYTQGTQNSYPQSTDLEDKIAQLRSEIQDLESN